MFTLRTHTQKKPIAIPFTLVSATHFNHMSVSAAEDPAGGVHRGNAAEKLPHEEKSLLNLSSLPRTSYFKILPDITSYLTAQSNVVLISYGEKKDILG